MVKLSGKPKVTLSLKFLKIVDYLHSAYPNLEWSGALFYKSEGTLQDPESLEFLVEDFFLCDLGTSGATGWEPVEHIEQIMEYDSKYSNGEYRFRGYCHSHHNMSVFFSGTDEEELEDNTKIYNQGHKVGSPYLSVIVNAKGDCCARACFVADITNTVSYRDPRTSQLIEHKTIVPDVVHYYECEIFKEVEDFPYPDVVDRFNKLKEAKKTRSIGFSGIHGYYPKEWDTLDNYNRAFSFEEDDTFPNKLVTGNPYNSWKETFNIKETNTLSVLRILLNVDFESIYAVINELCKALLEDIRDLKSINIKDKKGIKEAVVLNLEQVFSEFESAYKTAYKTKEVKNIIYYKMIKVEAFKLLYESILIYHTLGEYQISIRESLKEVCKDEFNKHLALFNKTVSNKGPKKKYQNGVS